MWTTNPNIIALCTVNLKKNNLHTMMNVYISLHQTPNYALVPSEMLHKFRPKTETQIIFRGNKCPLPHIISSGCCLMICNLTPNVHVWKLSRYYQGPTIPINISNIIFAQIAFINIHLEVDII